MDWKDYAQKQDCAFRAPEAERFFLELSDTDAHSHAIAESLEKNGVGPWRPGYNFGAFAAEWGYGYTHLRGQKDGMGREIGGAEDPPPIGPRHWRLLKSSCGSSISGRCLARGYR